MWLQKYGLDSASIELYDEHLKKPEKLFSDWVKLGTVNMIQRFFYHNIIFNDDQISPYNEERYLSIITTYI